jgi:hypothetical protein
MQIATMIRIYNVVCKDNEEDFVFQLYIIDNRKTGEAQMNRDRSSVTYSPCTTVIGIVQVSHC